MVTDTKRFAAYHVKAPGEEGEVATMDDHKREIREVGEGVEMDMQYKCARGRGQGYGICQRVGICQRKCECVEMGAKGCESKEKSGGYEIFLCIGIRKASYKWWNQGSRDECYS